MQNRRQEQSGLYHEALRDPSLITYLSKTVNLQYEMVTKLNKKLTSLLKQVPDFEFVTFLSAVYSAREILH